MHLTADEVYVCPKEDDYPVTVGFRDNKADYCVILSRFSDLEPDTGTVNVLVRDQIHTETENLNVELRRTQCRVQLDEETASKLLNTSEYIIDFQTDDETFRSMTELLQTLFDGLEGLKLIDMPEH